MISSSVFVFLLKTCFSAGDEENKLLHEILKKIGAVEETLRGEMRVLSNDIRGEMTVLRNAVEDLVSSKDFERKQIDVMKKTSSFLQFTPGGEFATSHAVYLDGHVAVVFTPHMLVKVEDRPTDAIIHDNYDIGLRKTCPEVSSAINITQVAEGRLGDDVVVYGFGQVAQFWRGQIARERHDSSSCSQTYKPWARETTVCGNEIRAFGGQHEGLSGAPTLSRCGYIGIPHAVFTNHSAFSLIIPSSVLRSFVRKHLTELKSINECGKVAILDPPMDKNAMLSASFRLILQSQACVRSAPWMSLLHRRDKTAPL